MIAVLLVAAGLFETHYTVKLPCIFMAHAEWSIHMDDPEKLYIELKRNDKNTLEHYTCFQFSRPDLVHFSLSPHISFGNHIATGETVATIQSQEDDYRLQTLETELDNTLAELNMLSTGEKPEVQEEARQGWLYAKTQLETYEPQLQRKRELYQSKLLSYEELDLAESAYRLYRVNLALQEAKLKSVSSGEKQEYIDYISQELEGTQKQVELLQRKLAANRVCSPISGIVGESYDPGVLCQINKSDTLVAQIPVTVEHLSRLKKGQPVCLATRNNYYNKLHGRIDNIGTQAYLVNGKTFFMVKCIIPNFKDSILPGSTGLAVIQCDKITLYHWLKIQWQGYKQDKLNL